MLILTFLRPFFVLRPADPCKVLVLERAQYGFEEGAVPLRDGAMTQQPDRPIMLSFCMAGDLDVYDGFGRLFLGLLPTQISSAARVCRHCMSPTARWWPAFARFHRRHVHGAVSLESFFFFPPPPSRSLMLRADTCRRAFWRPKHQFGTAGP